MRAGGDPLARHVVTASAPRTADAVTEGRPGGVTAADPDPPVAGRRQAARPAPRSAARELRARHAHVKVVGSLNLVQTLLREQLFDRPDLWVHPVVLGVGKQVFDRGAVPTNVTLLAPPVAHPKGIDLLRSGRAEDAPGTGDMRAPERGAGRAA